MKTEEIIERLNGILKRGNMIRGYISSQVDRIYQDIESLCVDLELEKNSCKGSQKEPDKIRFKWSGNTYEIEKGNYALTKLFSNDETKYLIKIESDDHIKKLDSKDLRGNHLNAIKWFCNESIVGEKNFYLPHIQSVPEILE